ncbi:MoxR family ATPase [Alteromonas sp. 5E99-2]|uniref:AAA family ATPase n=1 Tax=Alteromonas sp. 5E99-2 TaxID=2817683 RepID=UPI001A9934D8|nr:MoxR family ATPase [Alteromonas sp. 5E99-2]MBO1254873.1 MoxR family ATPase [Alteromonas sp. 5E99-2]
MNKTLLPLTTQLNKVILGKEQQIKLSIACLLANGHLLIEDLPGMGKTTLSHGLASTFGLTYSRIQFTSDLLPADMLGVSVFNAKVQEFEFKKGPIFNQLILADEINRASPKTQSALLESMEENQVSVDGTTYPLPNPFFVIATQNPSFQSGTYPLPESQLDRFLMKISLGYPNVEAEKNMLMQIEDNPASIETLLTEHTLREMQQEVSRVFVSEKVINFILQLVTTSRTVNYVTSPLSPRASKAILKASKAWAYMHNRDYVVPEDVQAVFSSVTEHRLNGGESSSHGSSPVSQKIIESVDPLSV